MIAQGRALLAGEEGVYVAPDDLRPNGLLDNPEIMAHVDLARPVGQLLIWVFQFVDPRQSPSTMRR